MKCEQDHETVSARVGPDRDTMAPGGRVLLFTVRLALAADPAPPPNHGILLSVGSRTGHVLADTAILAPLGLALWVEGAPQSGVVPLTPGMRVLGLAQGERLVAEAADALMYFDSNGDRYLDAKDPAFAALYLFTDADGDGAVRTGEVLALGKLGVDSISRYGEVRMKEKPVR
jgi:hypothetical protein